MKLVENWKDAWKWFSVQAMFASGAILGTWAMLPADLKDNIPDDFVTYCTMAVLALGILGRLVPQSKP